MNRIACIITSPNELLTFKKIDSFMKKYIPKVQLNCDIYYYWIDRTLNELDDNVIKNAIKFSTIDLSKYETIIIFNDISLLSQIIQTFKNNKKNLKIIMIQEGSTDFKFEAIKDYKFNLKNIYKLYKYIAISLKNIGVISTLEIMKKYFSEKSKSPYGFGIDKDIFILDNNLEAENYIYKLKDNIKFKIEYLYNIKIQKTVKVLNKENIDNLIIIHQPLFERFGYSKYLDYYQNLINISKDHFSNIYIKLHPRCSDQKKIFLDMGIKILNNIKDIYSLRDTSVIVGYSSTLLLELIEKQLLVFIYDSFLPAPDNLSYKIINNIANNNYNNFISSKESFTYTFLKLNKDPNLYIGKTLNEI
jgi:hypothetical protein